MKRIYNIFPSLLVVLVLSFFSVSTSQAGTMDVTSFTSMSGDCVSSIAMLHNFSISGTTTDISAPNRDVFALVLYDGHGDAFAYIGISANVGFTANITNHRWNYPYLAQPKSRPFTMKIFDNTTVVSTSFGDLQGAQHGTILDIVKYDPATYGVCEFLPVYIPPVQAPFDDGRLNNWDTASPIVVYGHDFDNQRGLLIYSDDGELLLTIYPEDLIACPDENTLILSTDAVQFYRLASCEYQLMADSLDGTKTYILIFTELYANTGYRSYEE